MKGPDDELQTWMYLDEKDEKKKKERNEEGSSLKKKRNKHKKRREREYVGVLNRQERLP